MVYIPFTDPERPVSPILENSSLEQFLIDQVPITLATATFLGHKIYNKYFKTTAPNLPVMSDPERPGEAKKMWNLRAGAKIQVITTKDYVTRRRIAGSSEMYYMLQDDKDCPFVLMGTRFLYRGTQTPKDVVAYDFIRTGSPLKTFAPELGLLVLTDQTAKDLNSILHEQWTKESDSTS